MAGRIRKQKKERELNKPVNNKPVNNKPLNNKPLNNKPLNNKPLNNKPLNNKPLYNKPLHNKPLHNKSLHKKLCLSAILIMVFLGAIWSIQMGCAKYGDVEKAREDALSPLKTSGSEGGNNMPANEGILKLDGKNYRRNTAVRAILCIGVDTKGEMEGYEAAGMAGQADGLFLVAQDMARDTVKILMIPRDTMTEITLFDLMGNELGKDRQHLTLAYAYGDGREESCELMRDAVSELLFGLKIDGYIAANISSIAVLNDEVGGVTVTVRDEGLEQRDAELLKGSTLCLDGDQAVIFVRYRDITKAQTAISRMDRQKQYMEAFLKTVKEKARKDNSLITRLVNNIETHMITNMAKDQYMDMGLAILNSRQQIGRDDFLSVPGNAVETERFDEFHPDREELKRIVAKLFYKEVY